MNVGILFYISVAGVIFGLRNYKPTLDKKTNRKALEESLPWFGLLGVFSAFRHIFFPGGLGKKYGGLWAKEKNLFESEAGVANLAFGILCFNAINKDVDVQKSAILGYAIYLFGSMLVHMYVLYIDRNKFASKLGIIISFLLTTLIMFQISIFS